MSSEKPVPAYWRVIEPYWTRISIYDGSEIFVAQFCAAPTPVRHLFATHWLQSEVRNGGFGQFFANSTGVLAPEAALGFRALGMPATAAVVEAQIAAFGPDYPRASDDREDAMSVKFERVDALVEAGDAQGLIELTKDDPPGDDEIWSLLDTEAGGFLAAANQYAAEASGDLA